MTVIATAGHVDHGKSSLIRALTGIEPDRLAEEQRKGMTIDLGFAHLTTASGAVLSFIDVPGHTDFIRTMIAGVSGVDVALLVVDAGEGWKPQTEEHLGILEVLGVQNGIVAVTKCDRVDESVLVQREDEIVLRLSQSTIKWSPVVRTSAHTGEGLSELTHSLEQLTTSMVSVSSHRHPRLFVDRVFTIKGSGIVVTGTLDSAPLATNELLIIARTQREVRVRTVQVHGESVAFCPADSRCAVNIIGEGASDVVRGDALVTPDAWIHTNVFDARLVTLPTIRHALTHRGSFTVHIGSHFQSATVRIIGDDSIIGGQEGLVRVRFKSPLPLKPSDRFLLRDTSTNSTIGGGTILDVNPIVQLTRARPDGSVSSIMKGRGFLPIQDAERLTGQSLDPVFGRWYANADVVDLAQQELMTRLSATTFVALAELRDYERDLLASLHEVVIDGDVAYLKTRDSLQSHPLLEEIKAWGITGPNTTTVDRNIVRQLVQRNLVYEHDSIAFHIDTLNELRELLQTLWHRHPDGFLVAHLREALGITRKHAVPLAECLDKCGLTRRTGDTRIPGRNW